MLAAVLLSAALTVGAAQPLHADEQMLWFENGHLTRPAKQLLTELRAADRYGLEPRDYGIPPVPAERASFDAQTQFDAVLSETAKRFVHHLHAGRVDPRQAGFHLPEVRATFDASQALRRLASSTDVARTLASFEPSPAPYRRLEAALSRYRALARDPTLTQLPALPARSIVADDDYAGAAALRRLLTALGDLSPETTLTDAIKRFQQRHGLEPDGIIGVRTFDALTTPLARRVTQIELAMERWRWITPLGKPDIVVNIPQFALLALPRVGEPQEDVLEMRVIVGKTYPRARTPVFATEITQVVFQPYWDVPRSILLSELLPMIRKSPEYIEQHDMEIVDGESDNARVVEPTPAAIETLAAGRFRLRQRPGPLNALGPVKFFMPNAYDVYLHATPERALFERPQRTYSHGCIRVDKPAELAAYVLRNAREPWDRASIDAALCRSTMLRVPLAKPVPVIVLYSTAVATRSGDVLFFDDAYGYDRKLEQLLDAAAH